MGMQHELGGANICNGLLQVADFQGEGGEVEEYHDGIDAPAWRRPRQGVAVKETYTLFSTIMGSITIFSGISFPIFLMRGNKEG